MAATAAVMDAIEPNVVAIERTLVQSNPALSGLLGTIIWHPGSITELFLAWATEPFMYTMYALFFLARSP